VQAQSLGDGFPWPAADVGEAARTQVGALPDGSLVVVDGLAFGVLDALAQAHAQRLRWVALVHHPLALETGLDAVQRRALHTSEAAALATVRGIIVTSARTVRDLAGYGVAPSAVRVVLPGTARAPLAAGSRAGVPLQLLCVASLTPRKGHRVLLQALAGLTDLDWHLQCAGGAHFDPSCAADIRAAIETLGLSPRVSLLGEVAHEADLARLYDGADAFVLPSFHEGYGMALAEALARGLPVISTDAGAIPDTVPADAGLLVPPGDVAALQAALRRLLTDAAWRGQLQAGARRARDTLPDWAGASAQFASALLHFAAP